MERFKKVRPVGILDDIDVTDNDRRINFLNDGLAEQMEDLIQAEDLNSPEFIGKVRAYILNRLIIESGNDQARIRLKALELLGRLSQIKAFDTTLKIEMGGRSIDQVDNEIGLILDGYMGSAVGNEHTPKLPVKKLEK